MSDLEGRLTFGPKTIGEDNRPTHDGALGKVNEKSSDQLAQSEDAVKESSWQPEENPLGRVPILSPGTLKSPDLEKGEIGYNAALDEKDSDTLATDNQSR